MQEDVLPCVSLLSPISFPASTCHSTQKRKTLPTSAAFPREKSMVRARSRQPSSMEQPTWITLVIESKYVVDRNSRNLREYFGGRESFEWLVCRLPWRFCCVSYGWQHAWGRWWARPGQKFPVQHIDGHFLHLQLPVSWVLLHLALRQRY